MGSLVSRRQKAFSQKEIEKIANAYHEFRNIDGELVEEAGFTKVATTEQVIENAYKLTPGIYVGTAQVEEDDIPYEEKMEELTNILREQFNESNILQEKILKDLEGLV